MIIKKYIIKCEFGLHVRPVAAVVEMAQNYSSEIKIIYPLNNMEADAKSIISVLSLGADKGEDVIIQAEGKDEEQSVADIISLLDSIS
jgi:phosphocarrier protein